MWVRRFYSILHGNEELPADTLVEVQVWITSRKFVIIPELARVRRPVNGKFEYHLTPNSNLLEELPPENWISGDWQGLSWVVTNE